MPLRALVPALWVCLVTCVLTEDTAAPLTTELLLTEIRDSIRALDKREDEVERNKGDATLLHFRVQNKRNVSGFENIPLSQFFFMLSMILKRIYNEFHSLTDIEPVRFRKVYLLTVCVHIVFYDCYALTVALAVK